MQLRIICGVAIGFTAALLMAAMAAAQQGGGPEPTLDELVRRLQDSEFSVRMQALNFIGNMKPNPKETAPHVIRLLKDPHYHVRSAAANALGNLQNGLPDLGTQFPECIPQLISMLSDRDPNDQHQLVRRHAAYALGHLGPPSKTAVPDLLKIAVDKNETPSVRTEAAQALGGIGQATPEVVAAMTQLLDDPTRINENYPTIGRVASAVLGKFKANAQALQALLPRLKHADASQRAAAAVALGTPGFGSPEAEQALLELLDDPSAAVQKAALSALEGINETYAFFFRHNVSSREVDEKRRALLQEIRRDDARKAPLAKIVAAQLRLGEGHHPKRANALQLLVEIDAREHVPMLQEQFAKLEKKTVYLERRDLRMQLLATLATWLPEKEVVPFLIRVDSDSDEAPQARFRAAILLCERGDEPSLAYLAEQHFSQAQEVKSLLSVEEIQKALQDRKLFSSDGEFNAMKAVGPDELAAIEKGIQLAQHLYGVQRRREIRELSLDKVRLAQGKIESLHFRMAVPSEGWGFELRKKGDWWLPCSFRMEYIQ